MSKLEHNPSFQGYPNNTKEHYTFNANKELIRLETTEQTYTYQRDALGRIVKLNDTEYSYDALGQVIRAGEQTPEFKSKVQFSHLKNHT